jgi:hypothetical protein
MEAQFSICPLSLHDLLWVSFYLYLHSSFDEDSSLLGRYAV